MGIIHLTLFQDPFVSAGTLEFCIEFFISTCQFVPGSQLDSDSDCIESEDQFKEYLLDVGFKKGNRKLEVCLMSNIIERTWEYRKIRR